ncbi:hypothetical protein PEM37_38360 [Streptomyces sp. AD681]|uniref:RipA family octameric membrane protein n=1 Tax=Streptomyces sp. AD681 TaxID=3019069 RepID=UPI0022F1BBA1|nr:hypothetical protein [Streptomyces sp. AD681]MDA5147378.1 hypothetical protein [Streptomyces sp. AD681]
MVALGTHNSLDHLSPALRFTILTALIAQCVLFLLISNRLTKRIQAHKLAIESLEKTMPFPAFTLEGLELAATGSTLLHKALTFTEKIAPYLFVAIYTYALTF